MYRHVQSCSVLFSPNQSCLYYSVFQISFSYLKLTRANLFFRHQNCITRDQKSLENVSKSIRKLISPNCGLIYINSCFCFRRLRKICKIYLMTSPTYLYHSSGFLNNLMKTVAWKEFHPIVALSNNFCFFAGGERVARYMWWHPPSPR